MDFGCHLPRVDFVIYLVPKNVGWELLDSSWGEEQTQESTGSWSRLAGPQLDVTAPRPSASTVLSHRPAQLPQENKSFLPAPLTGSREKQSSGQAVERQLDRPCPEGAAFREGA